MEYRYPQIILISRAAPSLLDTSGFRLALFDCARNARAAPEMKVEEAPALFTQPGEIVGGTARCWLFHPVGRAFPRQNLFCSE